MTDDDQIDLLRSKLLVTPRDPPASSLAALNDTVSQRFQTPRKRRRSASARLLVCAGAAVTTLAGSSTAYALSGAVLPRPVRVAADAVGLPVDSVDLADAKAAQARLAAAMRGRNIPTIEQDAQRLATKISELDAGERRQVDAQATALLEQAADLDGENPGVTGAPGGAPSSDDATTTLPGGDDTTTTTVTTPTTDDASTTTTETAGP